VIDLQSHILLGIEDGPVYIQTSSKIAGIAAEDGIKIIVATPHIKNNETFG
jgi:tyrosine-protein phosphatase YwqE